MSRESSQLSEIFYTSLCKKRGCLVQILGRLGGGGREIRDSVCEGFPGLSWIVFYGTVWTVPLHKIFNGEL